MNNRKWKHTLHIADFEKYGFQLLDIVENLDNICTFEEAKSINDSNLDWSYENGEEYFEIVPLDEFDDWWTLFYDFADGERIWVERTK